MNFKVKINNIGKLREADISVRPFTVLAGPNNTGKSFFSKALYSVFDAMSANLVEVYIRNHLRPLMRGVRQIEISIDEISEDKKRKSFLTRKNKTDFSENKKTQIEKLVNSIKSDIKKFMELCASFSNSKGEPLFILVDSYPKFTEALNKLLESYKTSLPEFEHLVQTKEILFFNKESLKNIKEGIAQLEVIKNFKPEKLMDRSFAKVLEENLTGNFQIPNLRKLTGDNEKPASIVIESLKDKKQAVFIDGIPNICEVTINEDQINSQFSLEGLAELQNSSRVIYIESPFYWKLHKALSRASRSSLSFRSNRKSLLVPKYFNDLHLMLMDELSGDMAFPDIFENLTKEIIEGKIIIDESGTLQFKEFKGKAHSLPMTATGIVQMGLLALLIEKKVLDEGTILFIDEPETNLHPAWQVEMMKILFKLVKAGAYVIMATHSADMLKWLEVHLRNHPKDKDLIALNQMKVKKDGTASIVDPDRDIEKTIRSIKKNLTEPFLELFLKGQDSKEGESDNV